MSELDDVLENAGCRGFAIYPDAIAVAREELELLREAAFSDASNQLMSSNIICDICEGTMVRCEPGNRGGHAETCWPIRLLRTDPERAKRMGLG